jgi:hypothetical protein
VGAKARKRRGGEAGCNDTAPSQELRRFSGKKAQHVMKEKCSSREAKGTPSHVEHVLLSIAVRVYVEGHCLDPRRRGADPASSSAKPAALGAASTCPDEMESVERRGIREADAMAQAGVQLGAVGQFDHSRR